LILCAQRLQASVLARCPLLLTWQLDAEAAQALGTLESMLGGGRAALAAAAARHPRLLLLRGQKLERRLALLALYLGSGEAAAAAAAQHPPLLTVSEGVVQGNARCAGASVV
jgi:hypothetical protein